MRIVIADDHPLFRDGLRRLLEKQFPGGDIVEAADYASAELAIAADTDLFILDLVFPGFDPLNDLQLLRKRHPTIPIVVMSMENNVNRIERIMRSGVNGYISKATPPSEIDSTLNRIMEGDVVVCASDSAASVVGSAQNQNDRLSNLSNRQLEVLRGICKGQSNKEIAKDLHLSPNTIRLHVSAVLQTLSVSTRTAAAGVAISSGLFDTENM